MQTGLGLRTLGACLGAALLAACAAEENGTTGSLTLGVTDAPVDQAAEVVMSFTGVTVKPAEGPAVERSFEEARSVDLLALTGAAREKLLDGVAIPAGAYSWIRLHVAAERGATDSYLMRNGEKHSLYVPSGGQTGLKLVRGFTLQEDGKADFTVDFELRKSIHQPQSGSGYQLRPSLRLVDNSSTGHLEGVVSGSYVTNKCGGSGNGLAVYVYAGADATPVDLDGREPEPVTTALVEQDDENGAYAYAAGYLPKGDYTVAFTCKADNDDPELDDSDVGLRDAANVEIVAGETTTHDFP
ncbi:DUF4382 domain-containing protein [Thiohalorhabdus methylotrophus]|uniref:DUF4382 domain-containing protein n=1 Tax=Thiohalorhabdus methylotrophus TaxID=3242694 RepID=A0ABV4TYR3_9GAMM